MKRASHKLIFLALMSVYAGQAIAIGPETSPDSAVAAVAEPTPSAPTTAPTTDAFASEPIAVAVGKEVKEGDVKVNDVEGTVEIHVNDASLVEVLRMLSMQSKKNILASKEVRGTVTANLYNVTIHEALDAILHTNGCAYREKANFIYVYTQEELRRVDKMERSARTEVFRVFYTPAANAVNMIKPVLSAEAQVSFTTAAQVGIASSATEVGGNSHSTEDMLVVTDYPDNLEAVRKVLKEIDRRPQQILIEATILRAALTEDNAMGVDFNVLAGVKLTDIVSNSVGQITGASSKIPAGNTNNVSSIGTGNSFASGVNGGLKVGFVSDNVSVFLSALEGVTDTTILANPKILALNKQKGEVIVGRKDGYYTTTVTQSSTTQTVEFLDTGTRLIFRPFIGDDGYVRMEIHPEDSSGGLTASNLPFKVTTEVTSNIMVQDGHTIVIGGLFRESSDSSHSQVPGLGNIPIAGNLFKQQRDRTSREEIIILLTPHIIQDEAAYSKASEQVMKEGDRMRAGIRKGMMLTGRERLAEMSYQWALDELRKPHPNRSLVLWHLSCALNLNPLFREARLLHQKLTGETISASDNSSIRHFITEQVLSDLPAKTTSTITEGQAH